MNAAKFTDGAAWEPKTLEDYIFLFGTENGVFEYMMSLEVRPATSVRVAGIDVETHTIYLEAPNG